ncbi:MAG TPA: riboflavin synthase [Gaiellales bacterium]|jgi:riboflavin synthase
MFTGIVTEMGAVEAITATAAGARVRITAPATAADCRIGDSVSIGGCCLTVVGIDGDALDFEAVAETLRRTTVGRLAAGDAVNVEPAMRMGDRLGGHWVQGHVDGVGTVTAIAPDGDGVRVTFSAPADVLRYTIEKGSICVAGVSLTVTACDEQTFSVALIPHTRAVTTLGRLAPGAAVNLEADLLGKYVEKLVGSTALIPSKQPS